MSYSRLGPKTEGGQGGKRGHSNMSHYDFTEVIKADMKRQRRRQSRAIIAEQLDDR